MLDNDQVCVYGRGLTKCIGGYRQINTALWTQSKMFKPNSLEVKVLVMGVIWMLYRCYKAI